MTFQRFSNDFWKHIRKYHFETLNINYLQSLADPKLTFGPNTNDRAHVQRTTTDARTRQQTERQELNQPSEARGWQRVPCSTPLLIATVHWPYWRKNVYWGIKTNLRKYKASFGNKKRTRNVRRNTFVGRWNTLLRQKTWPIMVQRVSLIFWPIDSNLQTVKPLSSGR